MNTSRRNFFRKTALGILGSVTIPFTGKATFFKNTYLKTTENLPLGIAGYTFLKFDLDQSIAMMKRLDLHYLSIKDFHLPLNSSKEKIKLVLEKLKDADINLYTVGVIYMKTKQAIDEAFAYAKKAGVKMIVGVPTYDLLDYAEDRVKSYDIKLAIHNHGPEDALYPGPKEVYNRIKSRDHRMGLCLDIGHAARAGADPAKAVKEYRNRIFDLHIKDVTAAEKKGKAIEIGNGIIDFNALVKTLREIKYKGICSIEFEKDMSDPLPGIAESVGFFKGVMSN